MFPMCPRPPNALTMKCSDFTKLDEATQQAVIKAILAGRRQPAGPRIARWSRRLMATTMCQFLPSAVVKEVVLGGSPP